MKKTGVITLAYKGTNFHGFARQENARSVQGELEQALEVYFRKPIETVCAGRTDTGVHALGQQVSFSLDGLVLPDNPEVLIPRSLNALTSDDIAIKSFRLESEGFSCRFDAIEREYCYRIALGAHAPLFLKDFTYHLHYDSLDLEAMRNAAQYLIGEHDFKSFCLTASSIDKNTVRELKSISIEKCEVMGERCVEIRVVGTAFLHNMIRILVGTLLQIGEGKRDPEWIQDVLEAHDRRAAGPTAPALGLTFWAVRY